VADEFGRRGERIWLGVAVCARVFSLAATCSFVLCFLVAQSSDTSLR